VVVGQGESAELELIPDHDARIKAARELLDRAYARTRQALEHTGEGGRPIEVARSTDLKKLSHAELDQLEELPTRATLTQTRPEHQQPPFVRALRRAFVEDARADVLLALRVHVLALRGYTQGQIAARLGASTAAVHIAAERLQRVTPLPDRGDEL
jgi:hypothetical protein